MTTATIMLLDPAYLGEFYFTKEPVVLAKRLLADSCYWPGGEFWVDQAGEAAAEELFDLTNNPDREAERRVRYARGRSLSVGDMVDVDGVKYLCMNIGWIVVQ